MSVHQLREALRLDGVRWGIRRVVRLVPFASNSRVEARGAVVQYELLPNHVSASCTDMGRSAGQYMDVK